MAECLRWTAWWTVFIGELLVLLMRRWVSSVFSCVANTYRERLCSHRLIVITGANSRCDCELIIIVA